MRRDKAIWSRKYPVEQFPDCLIIKVPRNYPVARYLRNPHMEDTIDSHLAAVGAKTTHQYIALGWVGVLLGVDLGIAFRM